MKEHDVILEKLSRIERILNERLPERIPSFKEFTETVLEEYWKLGGSFINYEALKQNVCARLLITPKMFDIWFNDLTYITGGKITIGESRNGTKRAVHILIKAKTTEELFWR
jgi:hypothetical protein